MIYSSALKTCDVISGRLEIKFYVYIYKVDGIVGNGEITHYQQLSFLLNVFRSQKYLYEEKVVYLLPKINMLLKTLRSASLEIY